MHILSYYVVVNNTAFEVQIEQFERCKTTHKLLPDYTEVINAATEDSIEYSDLYDQVIAKVVEQHSERFEYDLVWRNTKEIEQVGAYQAAIMFTD